MHLCESRLQDGCGNRIVNLQTLGAGAGGAAGIQNDLVAGDTGKRKEVEIADEIDLIRLDLAISDAHGRGRSGINPI